MFHLLVSYSGWSDTGGTMSNSRIYIRPNELPGSSFYSNGRLDISKISKIPALLVTETNGNGPQLARVARITNISEGSNETSIQYAIENGIEPIANKDLEKYSAELNLGRFGLSHTCWTICETDLFRLLLLNQKNRIIAPKVFSIQSVFSQDENLVSVMMPFKYEFNIVYSALQRASEEMGLTCVRADDIWEHDAIIQDVVNLIVKAKIVICDCSDKNPNVFYETGIAHSFGKEVILITQSADDIPFDLRHLRHIKYLPNNEGCNALSESVKSRIKTILKR